MTGANTSNGPGPDELLDVIVIGAGQAGLAVAWHLAQQGLRFVVLEAADQLGARGVAAGTRCGCSALLSTTPCPAWRFPRRPTRIRARMRWQISCVTTPPGSICRCN